MAENLRVHRREHFARPVLLPRDGDQRPPWPLDVRSKHTITLIQLEKYFLLVLG